MKPDIRLQALLAVSCLGLILSLLTYQVQTSNLCRVTVPADGGTLVEGVVGRPQYLNPLLSDPNPLDQQLVNLLFDGLTRYDEQGRLVPALARSWTVSGDGLTVTFALSELAEWHDGQPVTSADVAFTYGLLQDPDFPLPGLSQLWQSVTITPLDSQRIAFTLPTPYSPFLAATTRGILPAHLLQGVTAATLQQQRFNQAPVGTGPFVVASDNWTRTGRLFLRPFANAWRDGTRLDALEFRFFPDEASLARAFAEGQITAISQVTPALFPLVAGDEDIRLFSAPAPRYTQLLFNLSAEGMPALSDLRLRQALAISLDRQALIDQALNGQGVLLDGPYLPQSWAYQPFLTQPLPTDVVSATALLDEAGWLLPEAGGVRQKDEEPLALSLVFAQSPTNRAVAQNLAGQWAAVGVRLELAPVSLVELPAALASRAFDLALTDVAPLGDPDLYDFWSQEAIVRGHNYGGWNSRRASEALENGRQLWPEAERLPYYEQFQFYFNQAIPALTLYQHINTYALSRAVNQADIGRLEQPRDRYRTLAEWFLLYRDVLVSCPEEPTS